MKTAILTVGPQGAGKTTFCEQAVTANPDIRYVSRDKVLLEMFGGAWLDPYTSAHLTGIERFWEIVQQILRDSIGDTKVILDLWNEDCSDRFRITRKLRDWDVDVIKAWYFVTPLETSMRWFFKREYEPAKKPSKWDDLADALHRNSYTRVFRQFHDNAEDVKCRDYFDSAVGINPLQLMLFPVFPV